ncbi:hypothetical protein KIN20_014311 [Parelaphostrongylus tenuis]|uniref:Uncharacterized protein n=1 Tax=Parelaphostrongylus tenuis TaxID=148309 RepID=A0AAD5MDG1_PARTN|nr:hypothetical protein KIN20_014311 [Parelaphostrongylus tenuis]
MHALPVAAVNITLLLKFYDIVVINKEKCSKSVASPNIWLIASKSKDFRIN